MDLTQSLWRVGHFFQNGSPITIRARTEIPTQPDRELLTNLIVITWPYSGGSNGMPTSSVSERMAEFEETLDSVSAADQIFILALSLTGNSKREWRYYTADSRKFMDVLQKGLSGKELFPIDLQLFKDPDWMGLKEFHEKLQKS